MQKTKNVQVRHFEAKFCIFARRIKLKKTAPDNNCQHDTRRTLIECNPPLVDWSRWRLTYCGNKCSCECIIGKSKENACFSNSGVTNQQQFEKKIVCFFRHFKILFFSVQIAIHFKTFAFDVINSVATTVKNIFFPIAIYGASLSKIYQELRNSSKHS